MQLDIWKLAKTFRNSSSSQTENARTLSLVLNAPARIPTDKNNTASAKGLFINSSINTVI